MITIKPFKAYRPTKELAEQVAALPYDVMNKDEACEMVKGKPYSFLHVDKPEIHIEKPTGTMLYEEAARRLKVLIDEKILVQDETECLYIYGIHNEWISQYGLVGLISCKEYEEGLIKRHEQTRSDKEEDRMQHIAHCQAHTGPIFLLYDEMELITKWIEEYVKCEKPEQCFISEDGVKHEVFKVQDVHTIYNLQNAFKALEAIYIADGHHRAAAACAYAKKQREEGKSSEKDEEQFFLGVVFPKEHLHMMDYNRVLKDESHLEEEDFFKALNKIFMIQRIDEKIYKPEKEHIFGMRYKKKWYKLTLEKTYLKDLDIAEQLDVSILQREVLEPLFGIKDPRTDHRIDFVGGIRGIEALNLLTEEQMDIAFNFYPTSLDALIQVANENKLMPPKSTWFEPKLRSGLFVHLF